MAREMTPNEDSQKKKILIVDDHPLVREWLANLINQQADLRTCGNASSVMEALQLIRNFKPDVAIVDITLERTSGLDLIKLIKSDYPDVATVVLSMHDESLYAEQAFRAGAQGYVMKSDVAGKILEAIRCVLTGKRYLSERAAALMAEKLVGGSSGPTGSPIQLLSRRELEVFQLLGRGHTTRQIAEELHVAFGTVQAFCKRIKEKLNLQNATELLREAIRWNEKRNSDENETQP